MTPYHPLRVFMTLTISVVVFAFLMSLYSERAQAEDAKLLGRFAPLAYDPVREGPNGEAESVVLEVKRGWISSEEFTIAVHVVSHNLIDVDHGTMTVELNTSMFDDPNTLVELIHDVATIVVPWTEPPMEHPLVHEYCGTVAVYLPSGELFSSTAENCGL